MRYIPLTVDEKKKILDLCKVESFEQLTEQVPDDLRVKGLLDLEPALSELELIDHLSDLASKNKAASMKSFLGQGVYDHFAPKVIDQLINRGEFLTAYTPYQPEVSQGTLQAIFEYQSMMASLMGMEVSNASLYDGATALVEGVLMAARLKNINAVNNGANSGANDGANDGANNCARVIISEGLYPRYIKVLQGYLEPLGFIIETWKTDPKTFSSQAHSLSETSNPELPLAAVVMQSPNMWGVIEDWNELKNAATTLNAKSIAVVGHAHSVALFQPPGDAKIDIVTGEAQSLGIPPGFGGPHLGFFCCNKSDVRQMPGRLVGATLDSRGQQAFCVTLSTREQHIRREKATSNICSNQNLMAMRACAYLSLMGPEGLLEVGEQCRAKAHYAKTRLQEALHHSPLGIHVFDGEFFAEISLLFSPNKALVLDEILARAEKAGILAGVPVPAPKNSGYACALTLAFTEKTSRKSIDALVEAIIHAEDLKENINEKSGEHVL